MLAVMFPVTFGELDLPMLRHQCCLHQRPNFHCNGADVFKMDWDNIHLQNGLSIMHLNKPHRIEGIGRWIRLTELVREIGWQNWLRNVLAAVSWKICLKNFVERVDWQICLRTSVQRVGQQNWLSESAEGLMWRNWLIDWIERANSYICLSELLGIFSWESHFKESVHIIGWEIGNTKSWFVLFHSGRLKLVHRWKATVLPGRSFVGHS
jgi:hypothetical protein